MSDNPRIEELRRRVQKDPASIAFAQLAEEHRRSGDYAEAARVCRAGLERHPSYLSARVTLGRTLVELEQYDEAMTELEYVLRSAPENLAAIRGMAEIHQRRGDLPEALRQYQAALAIATHDPELEESVHDISRQLAADAAPPPIPIDIIAPVEEPRTFTPVARAEPHQPPAESTPGMDAAADEFTKAMQALGALSFDLPAAPPPIPPVPPEPVADPEPEPQPEQQVDEIRPRDTRAADVQGAETLQPTGELAAADELETWLDSIVLDRNERAAAQGDQGIKSTGRS